MDTNLIVRSGAVDLTADETIADIDVAPMSKPLYLVVHVPEISAGDTLVVKADFEDASNNTLMMSQTPTISAAGIYTLPLFCDHPDLSDLSVIFDITDNGGPDFGAVKAWISPARL